MNKKASGEETSEALYFLALIWTRTGGPMISNQGVIRTILIYINIWRPLPF